MKDTSLRFLGLKILILIASLAATIYLFFWNWQVALAITLMLWANNASTSSKD